MSTLLLRNARQVVTMNDARDVLEDCSIFVEDGVIGAIGAAGALPQTADCVVDATAYVLLPGLVNTHHHFFQTLTRSVAGSQDVPLEGWLRLHGPLWARLTANALYAAARMTIAELLLSGCTTAFDHQTCFPNDVSLDAEIEAARELGIRFVAGRGGYMRTAASTTLVPDELCEPADRILDDCARLLRERHDARRYAMLQIAVAPTNLARVTEELATKVIELARSRGARGHTHLGETAAEIGAFGASFGCRPLDYAERVGWSGDDVWYAHAVHFSAAEIERVGRAGTAVAYCPTSNMLLGSGVADLQAFEQAGVILGIGVDGGASNDSSNMLAELRTGMLLQRCVHGARAANAMSLLRVGTRGGAAVLGRDDIGALAVGRAADVIGVRLDRWELAGVADAVGALLLCSIPGVDLSVVNGIVRVSDGVLVDVDLTRAAAEVRRHASSLHGLPSSSR